MLVIRDIPCLVERGKTTKMAIQEGDGFPGFLFLREILYGTGTREPITPGEWVSQERRKYGIQGNAIS